MEDKELRKAFENTTTNNLKATVEHSNDTRKEVEALSERIKNLEARLHVNETILEQYKTTMANILTKIYQKGSAWI